MTRQQAGGARRVEDPVTETTPRRLREVAAVFLLLGTIGFGGPAAHVALMRDQLVSRRGWLRDEEFLDLLGATNLIPGPNSTELAIHVGYRRAGWRGSVVAGLAFIGPAFLIVLALAWAYVEFGSAPQVGALLYGVKPIVIAVVAQALWGLLPTAFRRPPLALLGAAALALYLLGTNELAILFGGGLLVAFGRGLAGGRRIASAFVLPPAGLPLGALASVAASVVPFSQATLFLTFLKIGAVLYGSGYVLLAFLRGDFVARLGWLTETQLLDAVAIGQVTPGPVFTTATFVGYLVGGTLGAIVATVAIFLPAFVFVWLTRPLVDRMRRSSWLSGLLDGVTAAAIGLLAGVALQLAGTAIVDPVTVGLAIAGLVLLVRLRANPALLIAGGGLVGLAVRALGL